MAQHNCEDLKHTDTPSTVPSFTQGYSGHALNPICADNPFSSQVSQDKPSNSMVSPYPSSWEHVLEESGGDIKEEDYPVIWFKFISLMSSKTVITGPSIPESTPVHVAYSPLASMNQQWTINLHDGYPPSKALTPGESISPSLLHPCDLLSSMLHFGVDCLQPTK